ncbi:hypothetical protein FNF27_01891 [Cafeteria roenbergensis]|uniref:Laminin IV type A domain-containing protein n=1 Tax=Cafeteria roenbergensis TaxID=33653 RepID=A0A5A8EKY9_CAFRO|nr:hypothetical protein FNF27_01891 [Cafeteria roenbergensis]
MGLLSTALVAAVAWPLLPSGAISPPWFAGTSFRGQMRFRAEFPNSSLSGASSGLTFSCAGEDHVMDDVEVAFGTYVEPLEAQMTMPAPFPIGAGLTNAGTMNGRVRYSYVNQVSNPVGVDTELLLSMNSTGLLNGKLPLRPFGSSFFKLGQKRLAGNSEFLRMIESFSVVGGSVSSFSTISAARDTNCVESSVATFVTTMVPLRHAWHASPWGVCSSDESSQPPQGAVARSGVASPGPMPEGCVGAQARTVSCRSSLGHLADETECPSGARPAEVRNCAAVACAGNAIANGTADWASQARIPAELKGDWTALLQVFQFSANGTLTLARANDTLATLVTLSIGYDGSEDGAPVLRVNESHAVLALDGLAGNSSVLHGHHVKLNLTGNATVTHAGAGRLDAEDAAGRGSSWAYAPSASSLPGGVMAAMGAPGSLSLVVTPQVPAAAAAFGVQAREAHASAFEQFGSLGFDTQPASSTAVGVAVRGTPSFHDLPWGGCKFAPDAGACLNSRPPVQCRDADLNVVPVAFCSLAGPLPSRNGSDTLACAGCVRYETGNWTSCSVQCGGGTSTRSVECVNADGTAAPLSSCRAALGPPPDSSKACNTFACASYRAGEWSQCTFPCGAGTQTRAVKCVDIDGELPESRCVSEGRVRPNATRACFLCACEDTTLAVKPAVFSAPRASAVQAVSPSSRFGYNITTSDTFCPASFRLLRKSEWLCYPAARQVAMCNTLNAATGQEVLPFAFRAERGGAPELPAFLPAPDPRGPAADIVAVRSDPLCQLLAHPNSDVAIVDLSRQGAAGMCRQWRQ